MLDDDNFKINMRKKNFQKVNFDNLSETIDENKLTLRKRNIHESLLNKRINFTNKIKQFSILEISVENLDIPEEYKNYSFQNLVFINYLNLRMKKI